MTLEEFKRDLPGNIDFLTVEWESIPNYQERQFCKQLLDFYERNGRLSDKQMEYLVKYTNEILEDNYE